MNPDLDRLLRNNGLDFAQREIVNDIVVTNDKKWVKWIEWHIQNGSETNDIFLDLQERKKEIEDTEK